MIEGDSCFFLNNTVHCTVLQIVQGYIVTAVSVLLWHQYIPALSEKTEEPEKKNASLQRLLGYMRPYTMRFAAVLFFVVISSLGKDKLVNLMSE